MKFGKDETVLCSDGKEIAIRDFLGEGGQGEVYLAEYNGKQYAFAYCSGLTSITFQGTMQQWKDISKVNYWNYDTGEYTVTCTDGVLNEYGSR